MDSKSGVLCIVLWLTLRSGLVNGQDNCTTFRQVGASVVSSETKLVCQVKDTARNFVLTIDFDGKEIVLVEMRNGRITHVIDSYPELYHCVWNETLRAVVVRIKKTTLNEDGLWRSNYHGRNGCGDYLSLNLSVIDKASTSVRGISKGPTQGQNYTLHCHITQGKPRTGLNYEWKRNGVTVAETGASLTITNVERSMHGSNYTCATDNGAGMGEHGTAFPFLVWYNPTVSVSGASHIVGGSMVTMGCHMTEGYPKQLTAVQWLKDGSALSRPGIKGGTVDDPSLTLENVTTEDAGDYVCVLQNGAGEGRSDTVRIKVYAGPELTIVVGSLCGAWIVVVVVAVLITRYTVARRKEKKSEPNYASDTLKPLAKNPC